MIRTVVTPETQNIFIHLPEDFIGKQVEVIVFALKDMEVSSDIEDKPMTHFASEKVLAKDWLTTEEDNAWKNL
jgi:hypothetical protein